MKKILIVDDDPDISEYLSTFFQDNGYATETAKDGVEAMEMVEAALPDLIALDITMPEKSGVRFYREMKEHNVTRQQLEEAGLILPAQRGQAAPRGPWRKKALSVLGEARKKRSTDS